MVLSFPRSLVVFLLVRFSSIPYHLPQFEFLGKLAAQDAKVVDQIFAALHEGGARAECAISLNPEFKLTVKMKSISGNCQTPRWTALN